MFQVEYSDPRYKARDMLELILNKIMSGKTPDMIETTFLLSLKKQEEIQLLKRVARTIRKRHFGNKVFMYGFIYFSTHCRNNCTFCHFRKSNKGLVRYRKTPEEVIETACHMADSGVHLIDLTMGEDLKFYSQHENINNDLHENTYKHLHENTYKHLHESTNKHLHEAMNKHHHEWMGNQQPDGMKTVVDMVSSIHAKTGLPVMISLGKIPVELMSDFKNAGAAFYACYQETHNRSLFEKIRKDQDYDERYNSKLYAKKAGLLIEEGLLSGIGDTIDDTVNSLFEMKSMDADQTRSMTFIPQNGTPLERHPYVDPQKELLTISVMRTLFPDRLIPASLDIDGLSGLRQRLNAGANVVTSLVPPGKGLAGVAHSSLDIEDARRTPESILPVLEECSLVPASCDDFNHWISMRKLSSCITKPLNDSPKKYNKTSLYVENYPTLSAHQNDADLFTVNGHACHSATP
ncbi:BioB2 [Desulfamplus magnetovallimortis]|uniref:BioB2 n=1 Tax=Desulfamplus magnetovallimortis TaxID=1246637 RepID=A0A1W1HB30_9BACT|nr:radical SAM protein [Desulfamplus magnetovallimortis]SLM29595.1 BioB2 [Desulfamplus magnetovallimortis]